MRNSHISSSLILLGCVAGLTSCGTETHAASEPAPVPVQVRAPAVGILTGSRRRHPGHSAVRATELAIPHRAAAWGISHCQQLIVGGTEQQLDLRACNRDSW